MSAFGFLFHQDKLVIDKTSPHLLPSLSALAHRITIIEKHQIGLLDGQTCYALDVAAFDPEQHQLIHLKQDFAMLSPSVLQLAIKAKQIAYWAKTHRYCGCCGQPTENVKVDEYVKQCVQCKHLYYPRISPCIIVLITRGEQVLLARSPHFAAGVYGLVAGFIEPGESAEEAVVREVQEEVGVQVHNIRYFGNQAWPFPHSLMIGFTAEYQSGEICVDGHEVIDAQWFKADEIPKRPHSMSIARTILDAYFKNDVN